MIFGHPTSFVMVEGSHVSGDAVVADGFMAECAINPRAEVFRRSITLRGMTVVSKAQALRTKHTARIVLCECSGAPKVRLTLKALPTWCFLDDRRPFSFRNLFLSVTLKDVNCAMLNNF